MWATVRDKINSLNPMATDVCKQWRNCAIAYGLLSAVILSPLGRVLKGIDDDLPIFLRWWTVIPICSSLLAIICSLMWRSHLKVLADQHARVATNSYELRFSVLPGRRREPERHAALDIS
jgi:hypothetical protein